MTAYLGDYDYLQEVITITHRQAIHGLMCSLALLAGAEHEQDFYDGVPCP